MAIKIAVVFITGVILRQGFLSVYIDFFNPTTPLVNQKVLLELSRIMNSVIDNGFVLGIFLIIKNHRLRLQWAKREQNLIRHNLETELNFLRSQVNPHFLFNTLNNFYSMAQSHGNLTLADGILKLSDLMRFSLHDSNHRVISLKLEIKYIESYINLTKLRFAEGEVIVNLRYDEAALNFFIPPMILVPFVENALKYGIAIDRKSIITIEILVNDGRLTFTCKNPKHNSIRPSEDFKGIGLANVRRRLELIYPQTHTLRILNDDIFYNVTLVIW